MKIDYGRASAADSPKLIDLRLAYRREDGGDMPPEAEKTFRERLAAYFPAHVDRDLLVFAARGEDGEILSCCFLQVTEKPPGLAFPTGRVGTVLNVYTRPGFRHRGLARRLMALLLDQARALKLDLVELKATEDGYPLYCALGFRECGEHYRLMQIRP
ncbi:MAG: GNAT family N-acetyltransferase [Oscillospiraceae bacterium]|nr:GNAT family N-acetyltransferase [Oscillospiraceae bacterium]